jgi:phage baseplate assembly protein W|tara:strand:+ start:1350 stop:1796 length:447 start_codon:yes stop_codon:yes gene_type:complete
MSTLEKNLYKNLRLQLPKKELPLVTAGAYRGISTVNSNSKEFKLYDLALIKQDIVNHFHIRLGEKLENPGFGTIIWDILYEPLTDSLKDIIVQNVTEIVSVHEPRVKVDRVVVDSYESGIQIECELTYLEYNISEKLRFTFDQNNGLN